MRIKSHKETGRELVPAAPSVAVQYKDIFNAKLFCEMMHDWLVDNGWGDRSDKKFPEVLYAHRFHQGGLEEARFWWRFTRSVNSFITYEFSVDTRIIGLKHQEVMYRGMKFKTDFGDIEVRSWGQLELDPGGKWRKHWFLKNFYKTYKDRLYNNEIEKHKEILKREVHRFRDSCKEFLKFPNFHPERENQSFYYNKEFE